MTPDAKSEPNYTPAKPRAKRRWYQFSLRAMFVWVAVIAVLLTVGLRWIAPAQRQRAAVKMIERVGGRVGYAIHQRITTGRSKSGPHLGFS